MRKKKIKQRQDWLRELNDMNQGKATFSSIFMTRDGKVNKITELTNEISHAEKEIDFINQLYKLVVY